MDHDGGYHLLFAHPRMVEDLVTGFIAEPWVAELDFAGMERVNAKLHASGLQRRDGDLIWRVPFRGGGEIYLYLLLEFQSQADPWMALRVMVYTGLLYQHLVAERRLAPDGRLPPVFPLVLYNGEAPWRAPLSLDALIALPPGSPLSPWQPQHRYHVLDEESFPAADLAARRSLVALLFRLETARSADALVPLIQELVALLGAPDQQPLRRAFAAWLGAVRLPGLGITLPPEATRDLSEVGSMLAKRAREWEQQWLKQGFQQGLEQGLEQGVQQALQHGREILRRQLSRRFGALPDWAEARVATAGLAELEAWSLSLLDAGRLEDALR